MIMTMVTYNTRFLRYNIPYLLIPILLHCVFLDMNECAETNMCPNGQCVNMDGAYKCICNRGYKQSPNQMVCTGKCHPIKWSVLVSITQSNGLHS